MSGVGKADSGLDSRDKPATS